MKATSKMSIRENESLGTYNSNQLWDIVAGWCGEIKCGQHSACSGLTWSHNPCLLQSVAKMRNRMTNQRLTVFILSLLLITLSI
jgi:hypothetical protein